MDIDVCIREVGPRDGLQSIAVPMRTSAKVEWITDLRRAGLVEIEVGSVVSSRALPQMADAGDVVAGVRSIPGLRIVALAPNLAFARVALGAGIHGGRVCRISRFSVASIPAPVKTIAARRRSSSDEVSRPRPAPRAVRSLSSESNTIQRSRAH
jgi:HMGL-like